MLYNQLFDENIINDDGDNVWVLGCCVNIFGNSRMYSPCRRYYVSRCEYFKQFHFISSDLKWGIKLRLGLRGIFDSSNVCRSFIDNFLKVKISLKIQRGRNNCFVHTWILVIEQFFAKLYQILRSISLSTCLIIYYTIFHSSIYISRLFLIIKLYKYLSIER